LKLEYYEPEYQRLKESSSLLELAPRKIQLDEERTSNKKIKFDLARLSNCRVAFVVE
jgi:hypothetical protein